MCVVATAVLLSAYMCLHLWLCYTNVYALSISISLCVNFGLVLDLRLVKSAKHNSQEILHENFG